MRSLTDYLKATYEKSAIEQIADEYRSKGYSVRKDVPIGKYRVDLAATKNGETIYIEVKTRSESPEARKRIREMTDFFKTIPNAKFVLAISRYQEPRKISFVGIEEILLEYFIEELPSDLDELSTHTRMESVDRVDVNEISIEDAEVFISCNGLLSVTLQYGSDSEQEDCDSFMESFPFKFKGTLEWSGKEYRVTDCDAIEVDTNAFYQ